MVNRRAVSLGLGAALAAPFVIRHGLMAQPMRVRRDVMDMPDDDPFFAKYADAVSAMHAEPADSGRSWMSQARIHPNYCRHGELQFLHWHRHYLDHFERICGELIGDPTFALPYWNWSKRSGILPNPFFDLPPLTVEHWNDSGVYDGLRWHNINTVAQRGVVLGQGIGADSVRGALSATTPSTQSAATRIPRSSTAHWKARRTVPATFGSARYRRPPMAICRVASRPSIRSSGCTTA